MTPSSKKWGCNKRPDRKPDSIRQPKADIQRPGLTGRLWPNGDGRLELLESSPAGPIAAGRNRAFRPDVCGIVCGFS